MSQEENAEENEEEIDDRFDGHGDESAFFYRLFFAAAGGEEASAEEADAVGAPESEGSADDGEGRRHGFRVVAGAGEAGN